MFVVGERYQTAHAPEGRLYLRIAPAPWNEPSSGSYQVKIATGRFASERR